MPAANCMEPVESSSGLHFPCAREHGHEGPHHAGRCNVPFMQDGQERFCTRAKGHADQHDSWVREADEAKEFEQYGDRDRDDETRDALGW